MTVKKTWNLLNVSSLFLSLNSVGFFLIRISRKRVFFRQLKASSCDWNLTGVEKKMHILQNVGQAGKAPKRITIFTFPQIPKKIFSQNWSFKAKKEKYYLRKKYIIKKNVYLFSKEKITRFIWLLYLYTNSKIKSKSLQGKI